MTENLTQQLIDLRLIAFAFEARAELSLNHAESSFDVAALVIVSLKPFFVVSVGAWSCLTFVRGRVFYARVR